MLDVDSTRIASGLGGMSNGMFAQGTRILQLYEKGCISTHFNASLDCKLCLDKNRPWIRTLQQRWQIQMEKLKQFWLAQQVSPTRSFTSIYPSTSPSRIGSRILYIYFQVYSILN